MAILELEEGRKKALAELVSYKATAKKLEQDIEKYKAKAAEWEKRAMLAVRAGDDEAAQDRAAREEDAETEAAKIERDKHEAASYAIQLNKSRKEFETKLQILKLRKGTLATQIAAARSAGGDAFGNDTRGVGQVRARRGADRSGGDRDRGRRGDARRGRRGAAVRREARGAARGGCSARRGRRRRAREAQGEDGSPTRPRSRRRSRRERRQGRQERDDKPEAGARSHDLDD